MPTHTDLPVTICPVCGTELDSATNADGNDNGPYPGALTLCIECLSLLTFDEDLALVQVTDDELANLSDEVLATINHIRQLCRGPVH